MLPNEVVCGSANHDAAFGGIGLQACRKIGRVAEGGEVAHLGSADIADERRAVAVIALHEHVDEVLGLESSIRPVLEAPNAVTALDEMAVHLARYHPQILAIDKAVEMGRRSDPDLRDLWEHGMRAWHDGSLALMRGLQAEGRLSAPWTVESAADMLVALMRDDVMETLVVERRWPESKVREVLATLLRRTFVAPAE